MKKNGMLICLIVLLTACTTGQAAPTADLSATETPLPPTATNTPTPEPTATSTPTPTPTLDPSGDPDGDGHPTNFEEIWGTDPLVFTSFEELSYHPGTIYSKMRVSQPVEVEDLNGTIYQVAQLLEIEDKGTETTIDDHFIFEVILFPYAKFSSNELMVTIDNFPIDPSVYPEEIRYYLEPGEITNITDEMRDTLLDVVKGSKSAYSAIEKILNWNHVNLSQMKPNKGFLYFYEIVELKAGEMFTNREIWHSTSRATLLAAELRSIGIPTKIIHGVYTTDEPNNTPPGIYDHPQNLVYINNEWVRLDYFSGLNYYGELNDPFSYGYLFYTDVYLDPSEPDWYITIQTIDFYTQNTSHQERCWILHKPLELRENE